MNNWFINARRRILQPMLEASNPDMAKKKKSSNISSKPYQKFVMFFFFVLFRNHFN